MDDASTIMSTMDANLAVAEHLAARTAKALVYFAGGQFEGEVVEVDRQARIVVLRSTATRGQGPGAERFSLTHHIPIERIHHLAEIGEVVTVSPGALGGGPGGMGGGGGQGGGAGRSPLHLVRG